MSFQELLMLWSGSPALNIALWAVLVLALLYFAREPAHQLLRSMGHRLYQALRAAAKSVLSAEQRLQSRNREVLLALAEEQEERNVEREFDRVNAVVQRDLAGYPALHRALSDQITKIDEDYRASTDVPPEPPKWVDAVDAVAKIPSNGDPVVAEVLENIRSTMERASKDAVREYRQASERRHKYLRRMLPYWRGVRGTLKHVHDKIDGLERRSLAIDNHMDRYEQIRNGKDRVVQSLSYSAITQFLISLLVLVIATMGGVINFHLIARPMSEMVGGASYIGPIQTADVAALVIIMIEIAMGLFLMESLRITRLFPIIGSLDDQMRRRMIVVTLTILTVLAGIEAALAYMRDLLALQEENLRQLLAAGEQQASAPAAFRWIPTIGQMVLGFVLPFALTFVAIPLESFMHSARTVLGAMIAGVLRAVAFVLRLIGQLLRGIARMLIYAYDLVIFLPLAIERGVMHLMNGHRREDDRRSELLSESDFERDRGSLDDELGEAPLDDLGPRHAGRESNA